MSDSVFKNPSKVYIGNIPRSATEQEMEELFSETGKAIAFEFKGDFGFVEYIDQKSANEAIRKFDGHRMCGRRLIVEPFRYRGGDPKYQRDALLNVARGQHRCIVTGISRDTTSQDLRDWAQHEKLISVTITDVYSRHGISEGAIEFSDKSDWDYCIRKLDGVKLNGYSVRVHDERDYNRRKLRMAAIDRANGRGPPPSMRRSDRGGGGGHRDRDDRDDYYSRGGGGGSGGSGSGGGRDRGDRDRPVRDRNYSDRDRDHGNRDLHRDRDRDRDVSNRYDDRDRVQGGGRDMRKVRDDDRGARDWGADRDRDRMRDRARSVSNDRRGGGGGNHGNRKQMRSSSRSRGGRGGGRMNGAAPVDRFEYRGGGGGNSGNRSRSRSRGRGGGRNNDRVDRFDGGYRR